MKKILAMLLALVMVLSLAACGGSSAPAATEAPKADAPAAEAPAAEAPAAEKKRRYRRYSSFFSMASPGQFQRVLRL